MVDSKKIYLKGGIILAVAFLFENFILPLISSITAQNGSFGMWANVSDVCASLGSIMPFVAITVACLSLYGINTLKNSTMRVVGFNLIAFLITDILKAELSITRTNVYVNVLVLCAVSFAAIVLSVAVCIGKPVFNIKPLIICGVLFIIFAAAYIWQGNAEITLAEQSIYTQKNLVLNNPPFYVSLFYYGALLFAFAGTGIKKESTE